MSTGHGLGLSGLSKEDIEDFVTLGGGSSASFWQRRGRTLGGVCKVSRVNDG